MTDDQAAAAVAAERASELAAIERARADLDDADRALVRLDAGTYGTCEVCAAGLDDAVLASAPAARLCPAHARPPAG